MAQILDPKLDVVFKLLFASESNRDILVALLEDVLLPTTPIVRVEVLNPDVEKELTEDRGLILDILALHADGTRSNIEMQSRNRGDTAKRALYHWARMYRDGVRRGDEFEDLTPCRVVFFLSYTLFESTRLHSTFRVLEAHDGGALNGDLELHFVELTKLRRDPVDANDPAAAWARFLAARSAEERRSSAVGKPNIEKANAALEALSEDPKAQTLARWREDAIRLDRVERASARRAAHTEGVEKQRRAGVRRICETLQIELTPEREQRLAAASPDELDALQDHLVLHRSWP